MNRQRRAKRSNEKLTQDVVTPADSQYGFDWGAAKVTRCFSDAKKGWVTLLLETPKHKEGKSLQIYVTKSGKVRIHDARGEWKAPNDKAEARRE